jgi:hypothetical protein
VDNLPQFIQTFDPVVTAKKNKTYQDVCWVLRNTWQAGTMLDNAVALASIKITLTLTK